MSEKLEQGGGVPNEKKGNTRRGFLKGFIKGVWGFNALTWTTAAGLHYRRELADALLDAQHVNDEYIRGTKKFIQEQYGVKVIFGGDHRHVDYDGEDLSATEAGRALSALLLALYKYPLDFFKKNSLPAISIAKNVRVRGEPVGGVTPHHEDAIVIGYYDDLSTMESIFHHELYHALDQRDPALQSKEDALWTEQMSDAGLAYAGTAARALPEGSPLRSVVARVASLEGAMNPTEDRATIAQALLTVGEHGALMKQLANLEEGELSRLLATKIVAIKEQYRLWSDGAMDDAFWFRLQKEEYTDEYDYEEGITVYGSSEPESDRNRIVGFDRYQHLRDRQHIVRQTPGWYPIIAP